MLIDKLLILTRL